MMVKSIKTILGFMIIAGSFVSCCDRAERAIPAAPIKLSWDLSTDNRIERVQWPAWAQDEVWLIGGPGTVHLKIQDGTEHDVAFANAQVWRTGSRIKVIALIRNIGNVNEVYADAIKMANEWQIKDREEIELFHNTNALRITSGQSGLYASGTGDPPLPRQIEIRQSFNSASGKPYLMVLTLGFGTGYDTPQANQPASKP